MPFCRHGVYGGGSGLQPAHLPAGGRRRNGALYDTYYHIFNRGNNGENIFIQERNYMHFLNLHFKYIEPIADTFAYCLLRNHFHLAVRIKSEEEILENLKTLKVSTANQPHARQASLADKSAGQPGKPLGSY
jgi:hypothetical protein